jgi:hypothetical protein
VSDIAFLLIGLFSGFIFAHNWMFERTKHEAAFVTLVAQMLRGCADDARFAPDCRIERAIRFQHAGDDYRLVIERKAKEPTA